MGQLLAGGSPSKMLQITHPEKPFERLRRQGLRSAGQRERGWDALQSYTDTRGLPRARTGVPRKLCTQQGKLKAEPLSGRREHRPQSAPCRPARRRHSTHVTATTRPFQSRRAYRRDVTLGAARLALQADCVVIKTCWNHRRTLAPAVSCRGWTLHPREPLPAGTSRSAAPAVGRRYCQDPRGDRPTAQSQVPTNSGHKLECTS